MSQSVERFSSRVENYARYRPGYPTAIIDLLRKECGLTPQSVIADIGSGTGKLSEIFLANGNLVIGVEPNDGMRKAAEAILAGMPNFRSVKGSAEYTTLMDSSIDFVVAGQAFHWFAPDRTKIEVTRILKAGGWAVIIWNQRQLAATPFLRDYESLLLEYGTDYRKVRHENSVEAVQSFFADSGYQLMRFDNYQVFDLEGLTGRVLSSSYTPEPGQPGFKAMMDELKKIFARHADNGNVSFSYDTTIYFGRLRKS